MGDFSMGDFSMGDFSLGDFIITPNSLRESRVDSLPRTLEPDST